MCRPLKRNSKHAFRTKRSLTFSSPPSAVSLLRPSLSPAHSKASTDRALTFLQSARDRNVPVRFGKWSRQEDAYLEKLIMLFQSGLLAGIESKTSLRSWLAQMLNCCPMRISKKQMHGHQFEGKAKYKRSTSNLDRMTQQQYDELCSDLWQLRAEFLKAWAKEEYSRCNAKLRTKEATFNEWYDRVLRLVPTPKVIKPSNLSENGAKRKIESLDELRQEMQEEAKRQRVGMLVEIRATSARELAQNTIDAKPLEPVEIAPLEPAPISTPSWTSTSAASAASAWISSPIASTAPTVSTACSSERPNMGDWLTDFDDHACVAHWTDDQSVVHNTNEARYAFCDDQVQVSVHLNDQQNPIAELSTSRKPSRLIIDFGAPSCWYLDEEPKETSLCDYSYWTDNDLTEELAMSMEPEILSWGDSPIPHMAYSPTLNFL